MSVKQFKFVSPGVFINEIDNSALDNTSTAIGPTIIGRLQKGPSLQPIRVQSYSEFVTIFGNPVAGEELSGILIPPCEGYLANKISSGNRSVVGL